MTRLMETRDILRNALELTTVRGIPRMMKAKLGIIKLLWAVATIGLFMYVVYELKKIIADYSAYPTIVNFADHLPSPDSKETFPSITLCNLKPLDSNPNASHYQISDYFNDLSVNISQFTEGKTELSVTEEHVIHYLASTKGYYQFLGAQRAREYGVKEEDFIRSCLFTSAFGDVQYNCKEVSNITQVTTVDYFNCYTIDINRSELAPYALSLILYVDNMEKSLSEAFRSEQGDLQMLGALMVPHYRDEVYETYQRARYFSSGYLSKVNLELMERHRLGEPYGVCHDNSDNMGLMTNEGKSVPYSEQACYTACLQSIINKSCKCLDLELKAVSRSQDLLLPSCAGPMYSFGERFERYQCALNAKSESSVECRAQCVTACHTLQINSQVTSAIWPTISHQLSFYNSVIRGSRIQHRFQDYENIRQKLITHEINNSAALEELGKISERIYKNFLKIEILYGGTPTVIISDEAKTSVADLMATAGSLLNLYSGITFVLGIEILDLIINVLWHLLWRKKGNSAYDLKQQGPSDTNQAGKDNKLNNHNCVSVVKQQNSIASPE